MARGMLGKKARPAKAEASQPASSEPTPRQTGDTGERAALRAEVIKYIGMGWKDSMIAKAMQLPVSTVYSIRQRFNAKAA